MDSIPDQHSPASLSTRQERIEYYLANYQAVQRLLDELINLLTEKLPDLTLTNVREAARAGEDRLALEWICGAIRDDKVRLSPPVFEHIADLAQTMGMESADWHDLEQWVDR